MPNDKLNTAEIDAFLLEVEALQKKVAKQLDENNSNSSNDTSNAGGSSVPNTANPVSNIQTASVHQIGRAHV